jgi:cytochrome c553
MGKLIMRHLLFLMALLTALNAYAETASDIAWTPELLKFVKNGNAKKGEALAETCTSCHGDKGQGSALAPALAGQVASYTYKQLMDYAQEQRADTTMSPIAKGLSEQDAADLAIWFKSLPPPKSSGSAAKLARAEKMATEGDGKRILPPCFVCHGANGQGEKMDIPALAGQQADYMAKTLLAYKSGERHNDIYSRMRLIAQQLSEAEIKELAEYYQAYQ